MAAALPLTARFHRALVYAARVHARQFRKGTTRPYIGHLLGVTSIVLTHGGDEDEAIAALLHDAVEDQGGKPRLREIRRKFSGRVARIVAGCTDSDVEPNPPWLERKTEYLRHLRRADSSVRLVSAADKLYNARETLEDCARTARRCGNDSRAASRELCGITAKWERYCGAKVLRSWPRSSSAWCEN
ncbi:MAG: HD domain-containing protein [Candidatus Acidiferrales bacterium]